MMLLPIAVDEVIVMSVAESLSMDVGLAFSVICVIQGMDAVVMEALLYDSVSNIPVTAESNLAIGGKKTIISEFT